ncbi:MAG: NitT/TauT family transport system permease protein, partial [Actinomycetota bacterium]|nr:NitT/TauT family transport system permease protein [Actinomycetota bacterium]
LAIDRMIFWVQKELFPHRYGGAGVLNQLLRMALHRWEDVKSLFWRPTGAAALPGPQSNGTAS